ncbi:hypothetical protein MTR67_044455 [Solanum verrucosum]|uniref:DUF4218 domain-containing protein n=1 Tax=Solanum verrucosum TaxID=315347 RepID=A0AAF0UQW8_SOLVR|nr:hypothetical protein MTR67_044455 [Solanum verrucosum]
MAEKIHGLTVIVGSCHLIMSLGETKYAFKKNKTERDGPPPILTGDDIWERVQNFPKVTEEPPYKFNGYGVAHDWTKQSIFWELPYWKDNLLRHNLDVMHIEKNYFDNLFNTVMDVTGKTKDNVKARLDLPEHCRRPELHLQESANNKLLKPKASYSFTMEQKRTIFVISNNLEKILPPRFFDVMEHLPIHLVHEALLGGPVQYRWMYPFERSIGKSKRGIKNKHRVEGCMVQVYLAKERSHFCSYYFDDYVSSLRNRPNRHDVAGNDPAVQSLSIFNQPGKGSKRRTLHKLTEKEKKSVELHVLLNCPEVQPFLEGTRELKQHNIIEVKHTRKYEAYDPFIIAQNAKQVYYAPYPLHRDKSDWWVVIKTKPMGRVEVENELDVAYQNEISSVHQVVDAELEMNLDHPDHILEEVNREELDMSTNMEEDEEETFEEDKWIDEEETSKDDACEWIDDEETSEEDE